MQRAVAISFILSFRGASYASDDRINKGLGRELNDNRQWMLIELFNIEISREYFKGDKMRKIISFHYIDLYYLLLLGIYSYTKYEIANSYLIVFK